MPLNENAGPRGTLFNIQECAVQDGEGLRTVIFLKGCPLRCRWCSNPEGQNASPELMHSRALCQRCGACVSACSAGEISRDPEEVPRFQRQSCAACATRDCVEACPTRAIRIVGETWSAADLYSRVKTGSVFFRNSGGGATLSGGEPLAQPEFVETFLDRCERTGLSVGIETCGFFGWENVEPLLSRMDFFYFDLKCADDGLHRRFTGQGNAVILKNLQRLASLHPEKLIVTIPVIPGFNAAEEAMEAAASLCVRMGVRRLRLLPYHAFGESKYRDLGREYPMASDLFVPPLEMERWRALFATQGIPCWIE